MPALAPALPRLASPCEVCHRWGHGALCRDCVARYAPTPTRCARCALRLGQALAACGACLRDPPPFEHSVCVADYGFPWDALITDFKFHGRAELAHVLARQLAAAVTRAALPVPARVLPVPLAPRRLAERGYNQAWELARRTATALGLPADPHLLLRPIDTAQQTELGRTARQRNLASAFMVDPRRRGQLQGLRVALVDDVMTTCATAREAAAALLRAGAAAVDVWAVARTPAD